MLKQLIKNLILRQRELVLYCIIGFSGVSIDYFAFIILTCTIGVHYQFANAVSVSFGICNNFFWNAHCNFKVKDRLLLRFLCFYCVGMIGLAISAALLYLAVEILKWHVIASKLGIIVVVTIVQFVLNKFVTFKRRSI